MGQTKTLTPYARALNRAFGLTASEAAIIDCMLDGEPATREGLLGALTALDGRRFRDPTTVKVLLCYARRKLAVHGISVRRGNRGEGPSIDSENLRRIMEAALRSLREAA